MLFAIIIEFLWQIIILKNYMWNVITVDIATPKMPL